MMRARYLFVAGAILSAAALLSLPAILNGYPFIFFDSQYYIAFVAGKAPVGPDGYFLFRPLTYSLLFRLFFLPGSLLAAIFFQNVCAAAVLFAAMARMIPGLRTLPYLAAAAALFFTPFPYYSNFVLPDIFSGLMVLLFAGFCLARSRMSRLAFFAAFLVSAAMHYANLLLACSGGLLALFSPRLRKRWGRRLAVLFLPWLLLPAIHHFVAGQSTIMNTGSVFLYSQLASLEITAQYWAERCPQSKSPLCPLPTAGFQIWDRGPGSLINRGGGLRALLPEIRRVNRDILTSHYVFMAFGRIALRVFQQAVEPFEPLLPTLSPILIANDGDPAFYSKAAYDLRAEAPYSDRQRLKELPLNTIRGWLSWVYGIVTVLSLFALGLLYRRGTLDESVQKFLVLALAAYFLNALIVGMLTDPSPRYSARLVWIFPFLLFVELSRRLGEERVPPRKSPEQNKY